MTTTYYTLRCGKPLESEIVYCEYGSPVRYKTFEDAYSRMCVLYAMEAHVDGIKPNYWGIWKTTVSNYNGQTNEFTHAVWR